MFSMQNEAPEESPVSGYFEGRVRGGVEWHKFFSRFHDEFAAESRRRGRKKELSVRVVGDDVKGKGSEDEV
jgi:hypothetical protein